MEIKVTTTYKAVNPQGETLCITHGGKYKFLDPSQFSAKNIAVFNNPHEAWEVAVKTAKNDLQNQIDVLQKRIDDLDKSLNHHYSYSAR